MCFWQDVVLLNGPSNSPTQQVLVDENWLKNINKQGLYLVNLHLDKDLVWSECVNCFEGNSTFISIQPFSQVEDKPENAMY